MAPVEGGQAGTAAREATAQLAPALVLVARSST